MAAALRFREDRTFTIVQFNDTQDGPHTDRRTTALQEAVLDDVRPDLVVLNGDVIDGRPTTPREVARALHNVARPMEERSIPWVLTFGNHDEDSAAATGLRERDLLALARALPHNLNAADDPALTGTGNQMLHVRSADGTRDAFAIWLLDSGRYAPESIVGRDGAAQDFEGYPGWDWLRPDQIRWYLEGSAELERWNGALVPGVVFQHIPLWEHRFAWFGSVDSRTDADHERAVLRHRIEGERNEEESPGPVNSGMFAAMLERGDVKGLFVGHDHTNTYVADYYGVLLGYGPGTGFGAYGLEGQDEHRLRGARVLHLDEAVDGVLASTELRLASEYGIDLTPGVQPGEPAPLSAEIEEVLDPMERAGADALGGHGLAP
ncbi:metallophosphoesterase family protein [Brachybacterium halotolerans subsp. kimchii]|uniref:metallophosphoesterase family protein n=1 Tax=Brachybacterium halotolerans TaxID=2795215 RepID=UPI001E30716F|nr:metallophosphoesterase family protein [Brachybacterium halotolerans]UEJ81526.1 metallophosphoesterase family protein [Brachybacterium halotolerans subsp. kimchii]